VANELRFSESEANEILSAAVRISAPGKISRDELGNLAERLGINANQFDAAEVKFEHLKTEAGEAAEFHKLQLQHWKNESVYLLAMLVLYGLVTSSWNRLGILSIAAALTLARLVYISYNFLSPRSQAYKAELAEWRKYRLVRLDPTKRLAVVEHIVSKELALNRNAGRMGLTRAVMKAMRCDNQRAVEAVDSYFAAYPDAKRNLVGF
jgi:hypothetical protein